MIYQILPCMTKINSQKLPCGNICHVPVGVSPTVNMLPRIIDVSQTVSVKLKRKNIERCRLIKMLDQLLFCE